MIKILYSFNKTGKEADYWEREISEAKFEEFSFIPFNHGKYINPSKHLRAQHLDNLFYSKDYEICSLYQDIVDEIKKNNINVLYVDNANPYHPEFLKNLNVFKVLRSSDCALITYEREIPYLHAFDYVLYYTPGYNEYMNMAEKFAYCRSRADLLPLGVFSEIFDSGQTSDSGYFSQ